MTFSHRQPECDHPVDQLEGPSDRYIHKLHTPPTITLGPLTTNLRSTIPRSLIPQDENLALLDRQNDSPLTLINVDGLHPI